MNEDEKRRWDSYDVLRKAAHDRFYERQKIEYRVLLSFWAAIAALIVLLLRDEVKNWQPSYSWIAVGLAVLSFVAWLRWTAGLNERQIYERDVARFFEGAMMKIAGLAFDDEVAKKGGKFKKRPWVIFVWAHQLQLAITALLLGTFVLVALTKEPPPEPTPTAVTSPAAQETRRP